MGSLKKTLVLKVSSRKPEKKKIFYSAKILKAGGLVAFPTETVYGIGANLLDKKALGRLYKVKKRSRNKPFTVHISNIKTVKRLGCKMTKEAEGLVSRFWPGPLTIILKSRHGEKMGFRMPDNKIALELISLAGIPVVAPSANISGHPPPTSAEGVLRNLDGKIDILLDGGRTDIGVESTVIDLTVKPFKVLREGAIKSEDICPT